MDRGEWIGLLAALVALAALVRGYLTKPSFVPAARVVELNELRTEIAGLKGQIVELKNQVSDVMRESEFWRDQYRSLKGDGRRRPPTA